jgi:hypothetical protein
MLKAHIQPGVEYALREKLKPGAPFQRVRILKHVRGNKWKAKWIDPNPGLVYFVESGQLIVPWAEHDAFLVEEGDSADGHPVYGGSIENLPTTSAHACVECSAEEI